MKNFGAVIIMISLLCAALSLSAQRSLSLSEALQTAKAGNTILQSEKFNINITEGDLITARLRPNPVLNNQSLWLAKPSAFPNDSRWNNSINRQVWWQLTKPVQWPSQRKYRIETAQKQVAFAQYSYSETERNISFDVASKWIEAWRIKQFLTTLRQAELNFDSLVLIQKARLRNQVITTTELTRTQIPLEQYKLQITTTTQDYNNSVQELKFLLGTRDSIDVETKGSIETIAISAGEDSLLAAVLRERPDIKAIQNAIEASESNIRLQRSLRFPQPELGVIYNPQNSVPYVGLFGTIELPLFSRNQGEISKSAYLKRQAQQNLETVTLQINTEITAAYRSYKVQKETLDRYSRILQQSREVLHSVRYAYFKGGTTLIDLLEAQRAWYDTQHLYYDAEATYYQSYIRLLFVTGLITQL